VLARSLVSDPKILLLDEPLNGLDSYAAAALRAELRELPRRTGATVICAIPDPRDAFALADTVAVLDAGHLRQYGSPFDIYTHPASQAVAGLAGPVNVLHGKVLEVRAGVGRLWVTPELRLEIPVPAGTEPGDNFDVVIRPENIRLSRLLAPPTNGAGAKIKDSVFLGSAAEYVAVLGSGQALHVLTHPAQRFFAGDDVSIQIDTRHCIIFPRGTDDLISPVPSTDGVTA
jgi:ABC-type Fe3+/spermidine/putrescine transport system ATPase subunit